MNSGFTDVNTGAISFGGSGVRYQHFLWNRVWRETPLFYTNRCGVASSSLEDFYLTRQGREALGVNTIARNAFVTSWPAQFTGDKIVFVNFGPAGDPPGQVLSADDYRGTGPIDIQFLPTFGPIDYRIELRFKIVFKGSNGVVLQTVERSGIISTANMVLDQNNNILNGGVFSELGCYAILSSTSFCSPATPEDSYRGRSIRMPNGASPLQFTAPAAATGAEVQMMMRVNTITMDIEDDGLTLANRPVPGSPATEANYFDIDEDGSLTCADLRLAPRTLPANVLNLSNPLNPVQYPSVLDLNGDNIIDLWEINVMRSFLPCSCAADIAYDNGDPLPPVGSPGGTNTGVNEGDYNLFFGADGYFTQSALGSAGIGGSCDISDDQGNPLPSAGTNTGVNEGDYNLFFNAFFGGC